MVAWFRDSRDWRGLRRAGGGNGWAPQAAIVAGHGATVVPTEARGVMPDVRLLLDVLNIA
jgi:hypothetical protein